MRGTIPRLVVLMSVLHLASIGRAQRLADEAGPLITPLTARAVDGYARLLTLDAEQRALARSLYQGYRAALKQADEDAFNKAEALTESSRRENEAVAIGPEESRRVRKSRMAILYDLIDQAEALERGFFEDVGAVLTPTQAANLPAVLRARRRETGLRFSIVAGEGVDLVRILDEQRVERARGTELDEAVTQYETEADKLLDAKAAMFKKIFRRVTDLEAAEEEQSPRIMEEVVTEVFEHGTRLRDVNRRSARRIAGAMPEANRPAFEREVQKRSFPKIYAPSATAKGIEAVERFDDLNPDQQAQLSDLRASYEREADQLNDGWASAYEAAQALVPGRFMQMMSGGPEMPGLEPLAQACKAREQLDERVAARLRALLDPAQRTRLDERKIDKTSFEPEFMPDFDDAGAWDEWKEEDGG